MTKRRRKDYQATPEFRHGRKVWIKKLSQACFKTGNTTIRVKDPDSYKNRRSQHVSHTNA